jgi:hypothetical protein
MFETLIDPTSQRVASDAVPADLDEMEPGLFLAAILSSVDVDDLSGYDRVVVLRAHQKMINHHQARLYEAMASVEDHCADIFDGDAEIAYLSSSAEIRCALNMTRRAADRELDLAHTLRQRLPKVWNALVTGALDVRRARTITNGTDHLSIDTARAVVDQILEPAAEWTTGQIAARLRKLCIEVDPDEAKDRYQFAVDKRHIEMRPTEAGTANIGGYDLPPDQAARVMSRINRIAESLRVAGEERTMDQLRADVFLDLLDGGKLAKTGKKGIVDIHVDLETLTRLSEHPGDLAGYGPVVADIARQVAENRQRQQWRYRVTNETGEIIDHGITRRRPTAAQRRYVEVHHTSCVGIGCRAPATASDMDHTQPWAENGPTKTTNLGPNCAHDHYVRHQAGWTYRRAANGDHIWTTRLGHTYRKRRDPP